MLFTDPTKAANKLTRREINDQIKLEHKVKE